MRHFVLLRFQLWNETAIKSGFSFEKNVIPWLPPQVKHFLSPSQVDFDHRTNRPFFLVFKGIYDRINCTTSDDWDEGHPFKDRRNIFLFLAYAKDRGCGFKIGRIRFNSSLTWFSFFFGLLGLLYHFFQAAWKKQANKLTNDRKSTPLGLPKWSVIM